MVLKLFIKLSAFLGAALLSVLAVQLLVRRYYKKLGRDYVLIERQEDEAC